MARLSKKSFTDLSNVHSVFCISIYLPTHRAGQEVLNREDAILLKNLVKEVVERLGDQGLTRNEAIGLTDPIRKLIDDRGFWSHQSEGLAIFLSRDVFEYYTLPLAFEPFTCVSTQFYLKPLLSYFSDDGRYYVLTPELQDVRMFEASRYNIASIQLGENVPHRLEDRVGYDYEEKSLQFRSQQNGGVAFHGQGRNKDYKKDEILQYFLSIDRGISRILNEDPRPLIVASFDYLFPIYKLANSYPYLIDEHVSCNPSELTAAALHERTWEVMQPYFENVRKKKLALFNQFYGEMETDKASADINDVFPASMAGRVDTLFIKDGADIWGVYDPEQGRVEVSEINRSPNVSLLNQAAVNTFRSGGTVYLLNPDQMPEPHSPLNALYRY